MLEEFEAAATGAGAILDELELDAFLSELDFFSDMCSETQKSRASLPPAKGAGSSA